MIEVGEYVRTKDKILKIDSFDKDIRNIDCVCFTTGEVYTQELLNEIIVKHSKNIIDLIEVGDYVNGYKVSDKESTLLITNVKGIDRSGYNIPISQFGENIKTILIKEQYNANCYKVEE